MAGPEKRRTRENSDSSSNESKTESCGQEVIQADFEGRNPEGQDFHGIRRLLQQLFLKAHVNIGQLADIVIEQTGIGSVLKQTCHDDEMEDDVDELTDPLDVFGVTSIINLSANKSVKGVQELLSLILQLSKQHSSNTVHDEIAKIISSNLCLGLLLNERFINIPAKVADPLLTSLVDELNRIKKKHPVYNFNYLIMICKLHKSKGNNSESLFSNPEEEIFTKEAEFSFEFDVTSESDTSVGGKWMDGDDEMIPFRKVLIINGSKFESIVNQVKAFV